MDSGYISRQSSEMIELAEQAGLGLVPWVVFNKTLSEVVPGSASIFMQDNSNPEAASIVQYGFEFDSLKSYHEHFAPLNPWNAFWGAAKAGIVYRSSDVMPARSFIGTEFYNDWLAPLDQRFDGIGIKLDASHDVSLMLSMQLPDKQLSDAETLLEPLLANVGGALLRAVSPTVQLLSQGQKSLAAAAIIDRSPDMAFAVDQYLNIVEANVHAESSLASDGAARAVGNKLRVGEEPVQKWLRMAVRALTTRQPLADHRLTFRHGPGVFRLSVFHIPEHNPGAGFALFQRYLVLVLIRKITGPSAKINLATLSTAFGLTPAELKMCEALSDNLTIAQAAERLRVTKETARDRLKQIFYKTGTSRQAELMALLLRAC